MTTTTTEPRLAWGLSADVPDGMAVAWGARAIMQPVGFSLLPDRQSSVGPEPERKALGARLNAVMERVQERVRTMQAEGTMWKHPRHPIDWGEEVRDRPDRGLLVILYDHAEIMVVGNSNGSYGYLYLAAWLKPGPNDG